MSSVNLNYATEKCNASHRLDDLEWQLATTFCFKIGQGLARISCWQITWSRGCCQGQAWPLPRTGEWNRAVASTCSSDPFLFNSWSLFNDIENLSFWDSFGLSWGQCPILTRLLSFAPVLWGFLFHAYFMPCSWWWWFRYLSYKHFSRNYLAWCGAAALARKKFVMSFWGFDYNLSVNVPSVWMKLLQEHVADWNILSARNASMSAGIYGLTEMQEQPDETWSISRVVKALQMLCSIFEFAFCWNYRKDVDNLLIFGKLFEFLVERQCPSDVQFVGKMAGDFHSTPRKRRFKDQGSPKSFFFTKRNNFFFGVARHVHFARRSPVLSILNAMIRLTFLLELWGHEKH